MNAVEQDGEIRRTVQGGGTNPETAKRGKLCCLPIRFAAVLRIFHLAVVKRVLY
jgi:hypothetical protein